MGGESFSQRVESGFARGLMRLPAGLLRVLAGRPLVRDGQTLDIQTQLLLKLQRLRGADRLGGGTPGEERHTMDAQCRVLAPAPDSPVTTTDIQVAGAGTTIPARVYRPSGCGDSAPGLVFYHGGGFVLGSLDSHDGICRVLAERAGCVVVSVDYRLAPEHPAPTALDDSVAAFRDIAERATEWSIDPARLAVSGDSAGGNLAAGVAQATRDDRLAPCFQLLYYPAVDFTRDRESVLLFAEGFLLEKSSMDWFRGHYIPDGFDNADPRVSPIFGPLAGVAPALVITGGFDPLRDEGEDYAAALAAAGVSARARRMPTMIHGFLNFAGAVDGAMAGLAEGAHALAQAWAADGGR
ncbi:alpha/beta hydrolase [Salinisphaera sp. T31B1]|uniref:alpha/beta hydrolase n=1 Tax=Salinisphaera sp. T31B1 TaxID=727963 RepID=UPI003340E7A2